MAQSGNAATSSIWDPVVTAVIPPHPPTLEHTDTKQHVIQRPSTRQVRPKAGQVSAASPEGLLRHIVDALPCATATKSRLVCVGPRAYTRLTPIYLPATPDWAEKKDWYGQTAMMGSGAGMFIKNPL